ncbi:AraC family transcriptional regulator of adaptative response/methylated-DNA-[protein]-cysteine methyltransferase [Rhodoligotrophos appendicifer]|uniref:bifunctional DNA-binding transcriptional regulator/O6-methylguanine-DNA methyltransferase Ada n=1 Tax=Rhodoligotrophos appendicifer TaxID=987056 RepID=UPI0011863362|nr:bifunctional DNA-binding transcriptional regulator/O6-methylguanine-DNA methyltransferase Ada [Rhodoligotrophos appendicifer]
MLTPHTVASAEQDPRWPAVAARDASADGRFVYTVKTTGIYCRPSCPSRLAKPEHVGFAESAAAAEALGYRACKRCRPDQAAGPALHRAELVAEACRRIEAADTLPSLAVLAAESGLSPYHFHRLFKAVTGVTPRAYGQARRGERVRNALTQPETSVTAAIYDAGFGSNGRFYAAADGLLGMTPTAYRDGGANICIRFAIGECSLGHVLVAASERGICAILLGDDPEALARELQDRFPKAELTGGDRAFDTMVAQVVGFVDAPGLGLDLPLDIRGTAFQQRVWEALREIPPGETASYRDIAERIGAPKAVRAVAGACAANAIAVAIPCHRVVRTDGALSGYRWGVERKRALLDKESSA